MPPGEAGTGGKPRGSPAPGNPGIPAGFSRGRMSKTFPEIFLANPQLLKNFPPQLLWNLPRKYP